MFDFKETAAWSAGNACICGKASLLAYHKAVAASARLEELGGKDMWFFDEKDTQGFLAGDEYNLVLAFRGTESLRDWMTDMDIDLIAGPGGKVHEGFSIALAHVWREVWKYIRKHRGRRRLWITGHSLGAALAALATAKLRLEKDEPVNGLYTFGQPRTGDREFARNFNADFGAQTFRYVNNNDIVTRVPFRAMGYSHIGTFRYFDEFGNQRDNIGWWSKLVDRVTGRICDLLEPGTDGIKDHKMSEYHDRLLGAATGITA